MAGFFCGDFDNVYRSCSLTTCNTWLCCWALMWHTNVSLYCRCFVVWSRKGPGAAADIESTSVKPRQRPRPTADNTQRQSQAPSVSGGGGMSEPMTATSSVTASASAALKCVDADRQQQHQQPQQRQQASVELLSDETQTHVTRPQDNMNSLIDLDPGSTLLANLDPLIPSMTSFPPNPSHQYRPSFTCSMPHVDRFPSAVGRPSGQLMQTPGNFVAYHPGVMPRQFVSYPMHGCAQQAIRPTTAASCAASRMMYRGVSTPGKIGSNNDLYLLQVSTVSYSHVTVDFM